jgi:hypothetical protein
MAKVEFPWDRVIRNDGAQASRILTTKFAQTAKPCASVTAPASDLRKLQVGIHSGTEHSDDQDSRLSTRVVNRVPLMYEQSILTAQEADLSTQFRAACETRQAFFERLEVGVRLSLPELRKRERINVSEIRVGCFGKFVPSHA